MIGVTRASSRGHDDPESEARSASRPCSPRSALPERRRRLAVQLGRGFGRDPPPAVAPGPAVRAADLENMSDAQRRAVVEGTRVLDDLAANIGAVSVETGSKGHEPEGPGVLGRNARPQWRGNRLVEVIREPVNTVESTGQINCQAKISVSGDFEAKSRAEMAPNWAPALPGGGRHSTQSSPMSR